jgi:hypothetical protein
MEKMVEKLANLGLPRTTIFNSKNDQSYYIKFRGAAVCTKLFHIFYDDVSERMYLTRKFERFQRIAESFEGLPLLTEGQPAHIRGRVLAFPDPLNRSMLAEMMGISPSQVTLITQSPEIFAKLQKLAGDLKTANPLQVKAALRDLRSQVKILLYGPDDGVWDDID